MFHLPVYDEHGGGYDDFDGGSLMSVTTGKSGSKLHRSAAGSHMSSRMSEYSDDWQTVASESDHGSYAMNSRHSRHAGGTEPIDRTPPNTCI